MQTAYLQLPWTVLCRQWNCCHRACWLWGCWEVSSLFFLKTPTSLALYLYFSLWIFFLTQFFLPPPPSRLSLVTGGEIVSTFDAPETVKLGTCDLIEEIMIGEEKMIKFADGFLGFCLSLPSLPQDKSHSLIMISLPSHPLHHFGISQPVNPINATGSPAAPVVRLAVLSSVAPPAISLTRPSAPSMTPSAFSPLPSRLAPYGSVTPFSRFYTSFLHNRIYPRLVICSQFAIETLLQNFFEQCDIFYSILVGFYYYLFSLHFSLGFSFWSTAHSPNISLKYSTRPFLNPSFFDPPAHPHSPRWRLLRNAHVGGCWRTCCQDCRQEGSTRDLEIVFFCFLNSKWKGSLATNDLPGSCYGRICPCSSSAPHHHHGQRWSRFSPACHWASFQAHVCFLAFLL